MKPKHQCHLSKWVERAYGAKSLKKRIIMWISIDHSQKMSFNSKKWLEKKLFLWKQSINIIYPNEKNEFMIPNHEKKGDYYVNPCLSKLVSELWFQKMVGREHFLMKPKHQCHLS